MEVKFKELNPEELKAKNSAFISKFVRRIHAMPPGICPISMQLAFLEGARCQSCGKCVPCREGLKQVELMLRKFLNGTGDKETLDKILELCEVILNTSDCAIGYESAYVVMQSVWFYYDEYESHINNKKCASHYVQSVPCQTFCPAHVDIPGYIALIGEGRYADCINLIRETNPFPTACAYVCEHPCESGCRRELIDNALNIRGLKKFAVRQTPADSVKVPPHLEKTRKKVAVIGGGPSGLTCAYFLAMMGHSVTIYERKNKLGGMLRYGIPNYRLPKDKLDLDINAILSAGDISVKTGVSIGRDISMEDISRENDAVYIAIGAQSGKIVPVEGYKSKGVYSAVEMLGQIGDGNIPDYTGKRIVVVGGGNVAMDCARSAVRCHAESVDIICRERQVDMTALQTEIQGAIEEGVELLTMHAPLRIKADENGNVSAYVVKPQIISTYKNLAIPDVRDADKPEMEVPCDIVLMAIGQGIETEGFENYPHDNRNRITTDTFGKVEGFDNVYSGGDCVTGPATAIKAIGAGRIAAEKIDQALGYHHTLKSEIKIPDAKENNKTHIGRVYLTERSARERRKNFEPVENDMSYEEAMQECSKCLRCDHYGCGTIEGGR